MDNSSDEGRLLAAMYPRIEVADPVIEVIPLGKELGFHNRRVLDAVQKLESSGMIFPNLPWARITPTGLEEGKRLWEVQLKEARIKILVEIHHRSKGDIQRVVPVDDFVDMLGIPENQRNAFFNRLSEDRLITRAGTLIGIQVRLRAEGKKIAEVELRNAPTLGSTPSRATEESTVFVSYARKDAKWLERVLNMMSPIIRNGTVKLWYDTKIKPSQKWREEIDRAMECSKVGLLLVTADFLNSDFINSKELPYLLKASESRGVKILWVCCGHCMYQETPLKDFQAVGDPGRPLICDRGAMLEKRLLEVAQAVKGALT